MSLTPNEQLFERLRKIIDRNSLSEANITNEALISSWQELLNYMTTEDKEEIQKNVPLVTENISMADIDTIFEYINRMADMDSQENDPQKYNWSQLVNYFKNQINNFNDNTSSGFTDAEKSLWNESLNKALVNFFSKIDPNFLSETEDSDSILTQKYPEIWDNFGDDIDEGAHLEIEGGIPVDGEVKNFRINDIRKADAGFNFTLFAPWVKPQYNINGVTYSIVRGIDKIISVLGNDTQLQFTRGKIAKKIIENPDGTTEEIEIENGWIRLLMPKYLRYVEVEDLNRNFWVIAQVITGICAYLFADDSPIAEAFGNIFNELVQLWENILYLWVGLSILSQQNFVIDVHQEILYLPNNNIQHSQKFDNFGDCAITRNDNNLWQKIDERLEYLKDTYPESHLVILPVVRQDNYKHNYYSQEFYPGIWIYDRNKDIVFHINFIQENGDKLVFNIKDYADQLYAIREDETHYYYFYPWSAAEELSDNNIYYALLRPIYDLSEVVYQKYDNNIWGFKINKMAIEFKDIIPYIAKVSSQETQGNQIVKATSNGITISESSESVNFNMVWHVTVASHSSTVTSPAINTTEIQRGYYQGELLSHFNTTPEIDWVVNADAVRTIPAYNEITGNRFDAYPAIQEDLNKAMTSARNSKIMAELEKNKIDNISFFSSIFGYFAEINMSDLGDIVREDEYNTWLASLNTNLANDVSIVNLFKQFDLDEDSPNLELKKNLVCQIILYQMALDPIFNENQLQANSFDIYTNHFFAYDSTKTIKNWDNELALALMNGISSNSVIFRTVTRSTYGAYGPTHISDQTIMFKDKNQKVSVQYFSRIPGYYNLGTFTKGAYIKIPHKEIMEFPDYYARDYQAIPNYRYWYDNAPVWNGHEITTGAGEGEAVQFLIMKKKGAEALNEDNWCITYIRISQGGTMLPKTRSTVDTSIGPYTYPFIYGTETYGSQTSHDSSYYFNYKESLQNFLNNPGSPDIDQCKNYLYEYDDMISSFTEDERGYLEEIGLLMTIDGQRFYPCFSLTEQMTIGVFTVDRQWAEEVYLWNWENRKWYRYDDASDGSETVIGEKDTIDGIRDAYEFVNDKCPTYSWEVYKAKRDGGTEAGIRSEDIRAEKFNLDDDYTSLYAKYKSWGWDKPFRDFFENELNIDSNGQIIEPEGENDG